MPAPAGRLGLLSKALVVLASVTFACVALWEAGGPMGSGHVAAAAAVGIAAENMLQWGIAAPVTHYTLQPPTPLDWYNHHPFGIFWWQVPFTWLLGHRELALRLPAVLWSAATPPLLYVLGTSLWGPWAGMASCVVFTVLPITLAFAAFNALEVPVIFCVLLCLWGTVRFSQTGGRRWMLLSLLGLLAALHMDWSAWFFVGPLLLATTPWRRSARWDAVPIQEHRRWWWLGVALLLGTALFYAAVLVGAGRLEVLLEAGRLRSNAGPRPFLDVMLARRFWLELCFTPVGMLLGAVAIPVVLKRGPVLPLAILVMATVQYLAFPNGADTHIFWPHLFAPWCALGAGALVASVAEARRTWAPLAALLGTVLVCASMLPDSIRTLEYGRRTGLRFDEVGRLVQSDLDSSAAMEWWAGTLPPGKGVQFHMGVKRTWALDWSLQRPTRDVRELALPLDADFPFLVVDRRFIPGADLVALAQAHAVTAVGPLVMVDLSSAAGPARGFKVVDREPTWLESLWRSAHAPVMTVVEDPFLTAQLRSLFQQEPNPLPNVTPSSLEELVVMHNLALAAGDSTGVARWRQEVLSHLERKMAAPVSPMMAVVGVQQVPGVLPVLHVVLEVKGPVTPDAWFFVRAQQVAPPRWSQVMPYTRARLLAPRFAIPSSLWRAGELHDASMDLIPGLGHERVYGSLSPSGIGDLGIPLLELGGS